MRDEESVGGTEAMSVDEDEAVLEPAIEAAPEDEAADGAEDAVQAELARLQQEAGHLRELYMRKLADFDNYRKRRDKEIVDFRRQANADLIRELLPVVDNLERALAVGGDDDGGVRAGVELTLRQFKDVLTRFGVVEIDPLGAPFDPAQHEAVSRLHTAQDEPNTVVQVLLKGYGLGDRLLRAALVVVAAPMAVAERSEPAPEDKE